MAVRDPHWSRDTPKGTVAYGGPRLGQETSDKEIAGELKSKKPGAAAGNHHILTQPPVLPLASPEGLAGTECNVWSKQRNRGLVWEVLERG